MPVRAGTGSAERPVLTRQGPSLYSAPRVGGKEAPHGAGAPARPRRPVDKGSSRGRPRVRRMSLVAGGGVLCACLAGWAALAWAQPAPGTLPASDGPPAPVPPALKQEKGGPPPSPGPGPGPAPDPTAPNLAPAPAP